MQIEASKGTNEMLNVVWCFILLAYFDMIETCQLFSSNML